MRRYALVEFGGDLQPIDDPDPVPTGREVLVRVRRCGVCHSDIHISHGYFDMGDGNKFRMSDRGMELPMALGHEILGEVVAVGDAVTEDVLGRTMLVHPWIGCGTCRACKEERDNDCTAMKAIGIARDGGYATHVLVPDARFLVDIEGVDLSIAAPLACSGLTVYSALKKILPVREGESIAIIGAGGLGLSAIAIARALGAEHVIAVDIDAGKREAALEIGADAVFDPSAHEAPAPALAAMAPGGIFGILDTVGMEATSALGVAAITKTGRYVVVGLHGGKFSMPLPMLPQKALTVRGSYVGSVRELRELVGLVKAGSVAPIPVATRPLEEADRTLKDLEAGRIVGRVVLTTDG